MNLSEERGSPGGRGGSGLTEALSLMSYILQYISLTEVDIKFLLMVLR